MDNTEDKTNIEAKPPRTESVRNWVASPEGRNAIAASLQQARNQSAKFREAARVKPESLNKPITR